MVELQAQAQHGTFMTQKSGKIKSLLWAADAAATISP